MGLLKARHTWLWPFLCLFALFAPGVSLAENGPHLLGSPSAEGPSEDGPRLLDAPPLAEHDASSSSPIIRLAAELGAMALTSVVLAVPGAIVGFGLCGERSDCSSAAGYGILGGVSVGAPLGVWWGARLADGKGTLLGAFLGAGTAVGAWTVATLFITNDDLKPLGFPLFSIIGALVGYELSHAMNARQEKIPAFSVQPSLAVGSRHALVGLHGSF
ncbi:hypothetical protein [Myxococcus sp. Y35]|uniref:hypothetical protein n=1 Tax=Pseudomyxococcus flavus TaxID=3115648 RepID=UPI003CE8DB06